MSKSPYFFPTILVIIWVTLMFIVNPLGNFPLNDDFQYARPVFYLINNGHYYSPDYYSPIIIAQVLWGTLFCLPGGFSFTTLRISVLVLGIVGIIAFYLLLNYITKNKGRSFLGAIVLLVNPFYFSLSYSFMTDTPFLVFALLSVYLFFHALDSSKLKHVVFATLFAILATLIRQFGIVIPIAYSIILLINRKPKFISSFIYFIPAIVTTLALLLGLDWLERIGSPLNPFEGRSISDLLKNPADILHQLQRVNYVLIYTGFFLLPILILVQKNSFILLSNKAKWIVFAIPCILVSISFLTRGSLPISNIINIWAIGPKVVKGATNSDPVYSHGLMGFIILLSMAGVFLLTLNFGNRLIEFIKVRKQGFLNNISKQKQFIFMCILGYSVLVIISNSFFDRYILLFIPFTILLAMPEPTIHSISKRYTKLALYIVLILPVAGFSVLGTHDYLAWNRTRWQALSYLTKDLSISNHKIDGGYEYNGWYFTNWFTPRDGKSWWHVDDDEYVVSFTNLIGYKIIKKIPYQNYLPYEERYICVLQRN